jgi:hypothetical protein
MDEHSELVLYFSASNQTAPLRWQSGSPTLQYNHSPTTVHISSNWQNPTATLRWQSGCLKTGH